MASSRGSHFLFSIREETGHWGKVSRENWARECVRREPEKDVVEKRERNEACSQELSNGALMVAILCHKQVKK